MRAPGGVLGAAVQRVLRCVPLGVVKGAQGVFSHQPDIVVERLPRIREMILMFLAISLSTNSFGLWTTLLNPVAAGFLAPGDSASFVSSLLSASTALFGLAAPFFGSAVDAFQDFRPVFLLISVLSSLCALALIFSLQLANIYLFSLFTVAGGALSTCSYQIGLTLAASYGSISPERTATFSGIYFATVVVVGLCSNSAVLVFPLTETDYSVAYITLGINVTSFVLLAIFPRWWFKPQGLNSGGSYNDEGKASQCCAELCSVLREVSRGIF